MSMYAYTGIDRIDEEKVIANAITDRTKGIRYYCPNPKCNAKMFLRSYDGERNSFFAASRKTGHIEHCPYGSDNTFNPDLVNEEEFNAEFAISNLMNLLENSKKSMENKKITINKVEKEKEKTDKENIPHTIKQIYDMCKSYDCNTIFNNQTIGQILIDCRSIYMFSRGIFGYRVIEAKCKKFLYNNQREIFLETPIYNKKYSLTLYFENEELFTEIRKLLYDNRENVIIVAGKWEKTEKFNCFGTKIMSKRQIKVTKQLI